MNDVNTKTKRRLLARRDILLVIVLLLVALAFLLPRFWTKQDSLCAVIEHNGTMVDTIRLDELEEPVTFYVENTRVEVMLDQISATVTASDCADQTCVRTGRLTRAGEAAICLPNRVVVRLTGGADSEPALDGITG